MSLVRTKTARRISLWLARGFISGRADQHGKYKKDFYVNEINIL
jgi:hypothetical protein